MVIFKSEQNIIENLDFHDQLVMDCAFGKLDFWAFCEKYNNFFYFYALDSHEADEEEFELLKKYEERIIFHEQVTKHVLGQVCADIDAIKPDYIESGRFGLKVAVKKLAALVDEKVKIRSKKH